jgi:hypothetical protein
LTNRTNFRALRDVKIAFFVQNGGECADGHLKTPC